jgi:PAS domain S-box-containing protein
MSMRVGELARRTGVGVSTLRAWESRFHFLEPRRSPAGHRVYDEADAERVNAVLRLVAEGLTLPAATARVASAGTAALPTGEAEALLYNQILEAVGQGIWVIREGHTRYVNRRMAEMMGYSVEQLVVISVLDLFGPEDQPALRERTERVRAGQRLHFTQQLRRADGSTFLAEVNTTPLLNQAGRYEGAVALVNDITARHKTETQAHLRSTLLDSIGEAVTAATPDGTVVYINAAAERLFGWRLADVIGRDGRGLFAAPVSSAQADHIHATLLNGERHAGPLMMSRRDGTQFLAHVTSSPAFDEDGVLVGLVGVISDETERNSIDRYLRARELQAETVALLGTQALRRQTGPGGDATLILTEAMDATRRLLGADQAVVLNRVPEANEFRSSFGSPHIGEPLVVPAGSRSFAGYTALARKVVVVDDIAHDPRFDCSTTAVGATPSAIGAPIFGPEGIVGVLIAASSTPGRFDLGEANFIQAMANIIGTSLPI